MPLAMVPWPFEVHDMVPLAELAPLTVAEPEEQIDWVPPAEAAGKPLTITE